jgi:hypothetical protein
MIRILSKWAIVVGISAFVFAVMEMLFGGNRSYDFGAKYGFPFRYMQDGAFATKGHVIWLGFLGDFAIALTVSAVALWIWHGRRAPKWSGQFSRRAHAREILRSA